MKRPGWILFAVTAILRTVALSAAAPRCPNLSGEYTIQGEDGQVNIAIAQHGCDRIEIARKSGYLGTITSEKHVLRPDGKDRKDSPWLGDTEQCRTSAKFAGSELRIKATFSGGSVLTMIYSLNADRDLLEEGVTDRRTGPLVAKRVK